KMVFVHPYNDPHVIAGQSTVGMELLEQIPEMDYIFSSIGGGGLVSVIGQVIKAANPKIKIAAGQASGCSGMVRSLKSGKIIQIQEASTFADGIRVKNVAPNMYELLKEVVDYTE